MWGFRSALSTRSLESGLPATARSKPTDAAAGSAPRGRDEPAPTGPGPQRPGSLRTSSRRSRASSASASTSKCGLNTRWPSKKKCSRARCSIAGEDRLQGRLHQLAANHVVAEHPLPAMLVGGIARHDVRLDITDLKVGHLALGEDVEFVIETPDARDDFAHLIKGQSHPVTSSSEQVAHRGGAGKHAPGLRMLNPRGPTSDSMAASQRLLRPARADRCALERCAAGNGAAQPSFSGSSIPS